MNRIHLLSGLLFFALGLTGQDFTIKFIFSNASNNQDSVITGINNTASYGYDALLDSVDITGSPQNGEIDARLSNRSETANYPPEGMYSSKANIIPLNNSTIVLEIRNQDWPISVSWEATGDTDDSRVANSVITEITPGFWGEAGSNGAGLDYTSLNLSGEKGGSASFSRNASYNIDTNGDTIFLYWIAFLEENPSTVFTLQPASDQLTVFPNPGTGGTLHLRGSLLPKLRAAELFDLTGRRLRGLAVINEQLQIGELPPGMYVLRFRDTDGRLWSKRVVRQ